MRYSALALLLAAAISAVPVPAGDSSLDVTDTLGPLGKSVDGLVDSLPVDVSVSAPVVPNLQRDVAEILPLNAAANVPILTRAQRRGVREQPRGLEVDLGGVGV